METVLEQMPEQVEATKKFPYCAEQIQGEAIKYRLGKIHRKQFPLGP
jgi:hypothetical protein